MNSTKTKITVQELNLSNEQISEVRKIQTKTQITGKRDLIRNVLGCSLCVICGQLPSYLIKEDLDGVTRNSSYCKKCYHSIYLKNKDMTNEDLAELYGCTIAPEGTFGGGKTDVI